MHVIFISNRMASTKSINVSGIHIVLAAGILIIAVILLALFFSRYNSSEKIAVNEEKQQISQGNLQSLATRLGELQAKVIELDALGERLSVLAGIRPTTYKPATLDAPSINLQPENNKAKEVQPGQGGPLIPAEIKSEDIELVIDALSRDILKRSNHLQNVEIELLGKKLQQYFMPTSSPIPDAKVSSNFGTRRDPFTGGLAYHRGVDIPVPIGTPVESAAAGLITRSEYHGEYGNLIEIDHGNGLATRYAHLLESKVNVGQAVKRGHLVGLAGSTGRSTGSHLHFEVLVDGVQQNPMSFLERGKQFIANR